MSLKKRWFRSSVRGDPQTWYLPIVCPQYVSVQWRLNSSIVPSSFQVCLKWHHGCYNQGRVWARPHFVIGQTFLRVCVHGICLPECWSCVCVTSAVGEMKSLGLSNKHWNFTSTFVVCVPSLCTCLWHVLDRFWAQKSLRTGSQFKMWIRWTALRPRNSVSPMKLFLERAGLNHFY